MRFITERIFTLPHHRTRSLTSQRLPHAIDFDPSGANGVGPIVSHILNGRGAARVIVLRDKSKGDEPYDSSSVKYKDW